MVLGSKTEPLSSEWMTNQSRGCEIVNSTFLMWAICTNYEVFFAKENKENCNYSGLHVKHMYVHILFPNLPTREIKVPQSRYLLNHLTLRHDKWFSFSLISAQTKTLNLYLLLHSQLLFSALIGFSMQLLVCLKPLNVSALPRKEEKVKCLSNRSKT